VKFEEGKTKIQTNAHQQQKKGHHHLRISLETTSHQRETILVFEAAVCNQAPLVKVVRARCSVSILGTLADKIELPFLYFEPSLYPFRDRLERTEPNFCRSSHSNS
jgi:hypothetical protein